MRSVTVQVLCTVVALALLASCASSQMRAEVKRYASEVARLETVLAGLAPGDPKVPDLKKALAEANLKLSAAKTKAKGEIKGKLAGVFGLFDKLLTGASPVLSVLLPGIGGITALIGKGLGMVIGALHTKGTPA